MSCPKPRSLHSKGFTLIELLIAISIIAVLAAIGMAMYPQIQKKVHDAKRKSDLHDMSVALEQYKMVTNSYPSGRAFSCWNADTWGGSPAGFLKSALVTGGYMDKLPSDPGTNAEGGGGNYLGDNAPTDQCYVYDSSDGTSYILGTNLEIQLGTASGLGNYQVKSKQ